MKKFLCAIAVGGLCSAVSAVESSNVVGYMTPDTFRTGNTMFGPMFVKVGTQDELEMGSYDVQDLIPTGTSVPNGETVGAAISLQKLTATGGIDGNILYWRDGLFGGRTKIQYHGWYTGSGTTPAAMTIEAGQAVWIDMPAGASCTFTVNGEVPKGDVYYGLRQGNTAVCNPQPAAIDVQNILPYAAEGSTVPNGETVGAAISLQKLTATGGIDGSILYWRDGLFGGRTKIQYHGWYTGSGTTPATLSINPGEGLWVDNPSSESVSLLFPTVLPSGN